MTGKESEARSEPHRWTRRGFASLLAGAVSAGCLRTGTGDATPTASGTDAPPGTTEAAAATAIDENAATNADTDTPSGLGEAWATDLSGRTNVVRVAPDGDTVIVGGLEGISAVSAADGTVAWTTDTSMLFTLPAVTASTVYAPGDDGTLYALSQSDGSTRWTFEAETGLTTVPLAVTERARLIVGAGETGGRTVGAVGESEYDPTYLYALDMTGTEVWSIETANGDPVSAVAVHDDRLYLRTYNRIEAHSLSDGTRTWRVGPHDVQWENISRTPYRARRMFADENGVYAPTRDGITALAPDGTKRWRFEPFDSPSRYQYAPGTLFVGAEDNAVYAVDTADGSRRWRTQLDGAVNVLVRDGEALWTGTEAATIGQLDPESGEQVFTHGVADAVAAGDAVGATEFFCMTGQTLSKFERR
ncbi:PQQ-binding-like beta-propeller repeat protein [Haloarcula marina]|uniref:outer membrane protein assembly factor BamB family protein n=1 Tax=Haloarcula marina TaxID=2961574 RepID=UPI0020B8F788|nr:PQQ-binding-like beta-propeller repeat protein [Halomicroarcula marina]